MRHLFYLNIIIMKKLLTFAALFAVVALTSCKYDDDDIWNSVHGLENRVAKLEELCKQMNTNISSLQTIVTALQNNDYVTGATPLMKDGKEIGYTITFSKSNPITIYHGKDGQDGEDGTTPTIGVKQDADLSLIHISEPTRLARTAKMEKMVLVGIPCFQAWIIKPAPTM